MKYIPALDGLRGIAIIAVLLRHALVALGGFLGVDVFFTLSGFLITSILLNDHNSSEINLREFYRRRALRLIPALFAVIIFCTAVLPMPRYSALPAIFYFSNWYGVLGYDLGPLVHTWSLSIEEQFYILWPPVLIILLKYCRRYPIILSILITIIIAIMPYRWWLWNDNATIWRIYFGLDTRADSLLIGCALAFVVTQSKQQTFPTMRKLAPYALVLLCILFFTSPFNHLSFRLLALFSIVPLLTCLLILWALSSPGVLTWKPLVFLGKISYGVYLWHFPVYLLIVGHMEHFDWRFLPAIICSIVVAYASYICIEQPFLKLKDRGLRREDSVCVNTER